MYIQKRKNAWYLRQSIWDSETKKPKTVSTYLASNPYDAKLRVKELAPSEYSELSARIDELDAPKAEDIKADAIKKLEHLERLARFADANELSDVLSDALDKILRVKINPPNKSKENAPSKTKSKKSAPSNALSTDQIKKKILSRVKKDHSQYSLVWLNDATAQITDPFGHIEQYIWVHATGKIQHLTEEFLFDFL